MGSRLGRRVIHFANLPIKLLMPNPPFESIHEIALKTIPSASKIEIKRVLESLYGLDVAEVRTLNMEGKKRRRGPYLAARPDYKKAYVTLREPLSLSPELFPLKVIQEERERVAAAAKKAAAKPSVVVGEGMGRTAHWLDERREEEDMEDGGGYRRRGFGGKDPRKGGRNKGKKDAKVEEGKFPWSSMRLWKR